MIKIDTPELVQTAKSKGDVEAQDKLLSHLQDRFREDLEKSIGIPRIAPKIGIIGVMTDKTGNQLDLNGTWNIGSQAEFDTDIYQGISSAKVGIPNPVDSLPNLSVVDDRLTPSIEKLEHLRGMTKDDHLTRAMLESGVVDERLPVSDREKLKALVANFDFTANNHWFTEGDVDLDTAKAIDRNSARYDRFEKMLESHAPEISKSLKYVCENFSNLDQGSKGYLTAMDYESALLNSKLDPEARKALTNGLDHKLFGNVGDIQLETLAEAAARGFVPFDKEWRFSLTMASPYHAFRDDLKSIRKVDEEVRMKYLQLYSGIDNADVR